MSSPQPKRKPDGKAAGRMAGSTQSEVASAPRARRNVDDTSSDLWSSPPTSPPTTLPSSSRISAHGSAVLPDRELSMTRGTLNPSESLVANRKRSASGSQRQGSALPAPHSSSQTLSDLISWSSPAARNAAASSAQRALHGTTSAHQQLHDVAHSKHSATSMQAQASGHPDQAQSTSRPSPCSQQGALPIPIATRRLSHRQSLSSQGTGEEDPSQGVISGSFTRSRMSIGDDEEMTAFPFGAAAEPISSNASSGTANLSNLFVDDLVQLSTRHKVERDRSTSYQRQDADQASAHSDLRHSRGDLSVQSQDTDWDEELGITETRQGPASLLKPLNLQISKQQANPHQGIGPRFAGPSQSHSLAVQAPSSGLYEVSSQIRGLRVTQSINESWDEDFLFQTDGADAGDHSAVRSAETGSGNRRRPGPGGMDATRSAAADTAAGMNRDRSAGAFGDESDDDEESWDAAFSWEDPLHHHSSQRKSASPGALAPSASMRNSFNTLDAPGTSARPSGSCSGFASVPGSQASVQHVGWPRSSAAGHQMARHSVAEHARTGSTSSQLSVLTDLSAQLAAQSEVSSWRTRSSSDSRDDQLGIGSGSPSANIQVRTATVKAVEGTARYRTPVANNLHETSLDDSGEETETEADVSIGRSQPQQGKQTKRLSLFSSFTRGKSRRGRSSVGHSEAEFATKAGKEPRPRQGALGAVPAKAEHAGPSWTSAGAESRFYKIGTLSLSRYSVTEPCPSDAEREQQPSHEHVTENSAGNSSRASLNSFRSHRSRRSLVAVVPSQLEKGYRALRNSLGAKSNDDAHISVPPPTDSPLRQGGRLLQETPLRDLEVGPSASSKALMKAFTKARQTEVAMQTSTVGLSADLGIHHSRSTAVARPGSSPSVRSLSQRSNERPSTYRTMSAEPLSSNFDAESGASHNFHASSLTPPANAAAGRSVGNDADSRPRLAPEPDSPCASPSRARRDHSSSATLRASVRDGRGERLRLKTADSSLDREFAAISINPAQSGTSRKSRIVGLSQTNRKASSRHASPHGGAKEIPPANSRTASAASATTSACSSEVASGSHLKDSSWSGTEMYDSETTHGTSVSSDSPSGDHAYDHKYRLGLTASPDSFQEDRSTRGRSKPASSRGEADSTSRSKPPPMQPSLWTKLQGTDVLQRKETSTYAEMSGRILADASNVEDGPGQASGFAPSTSTYPSPPAPTPAAAQPPSKETERRQMGRRNSLSDLRIPSRISKAQTGIRANITLVRDFAKGIEDLKALRTRHEELRSLLYTSGASLDAVVEQSLVARFQGWWECAEVLIGLGEGRGEADAEADVRTVSQSPVAGRERRITLEGSTSRRANNVSQPPRLERLSLQPTHTNRSLVPQNMVGSRSERRAEGSKSRTSSTSSRYLNPQREMDIIAAMLNGASISLQASSTATADTSDIRTERSAKQTRSPEDDAGSTSVDDPSAWSVHASHSTETSPTEVTSAGRSPVTSLSFADASPPPRRVDRPQETSPLAPSYPYHRAPATAGSRASLLGAISSDSIGLTDGNKSAKRRLRSASRAGLQGLKELLRAFRSNSNEEEAHDKPSSVDREDGAHNRYLSPFRKSVDAAATAKDGVEALPSDAKAAELSAAKRSLSGSTEIRGERPPSSDRPKSPKTSPERRRSYLFRRKKDAESSSPRLAPGTPPFSHDSPSSRRLTSVPSSPLLESSADSTSRSETEVGRRRNDGAKTRPATASSSEVRRRAARLSDRAAVRSSPAPPARVSSSHGRNMSDLGDVGRVPVERLYGDRKASPSWSTVADAGRSGPEPRSQAATAEARIAPTSFVDAHARSKVQRSQIGKGRPSQTTTNVLPRSLSLSRPPSPSLLGPSTIDFDLDASQPTHSATHRLSPDTKASGSALASFGGGSSSQQSMSSDLIRQDSSPSVDLGSDAASTATSFQKMALKPEAMSSLIVYVQATRQHCQEAIETLKQEVEALGGPSL